METPMDDRYVFLVIEKFAVDLLLWFVISTP